MSEPTTEAGRAHFEEGWCEHKSAHIAAIEAEARADAESKVRLLEGQVEALERVGAAASRWQGASDLWKKRALAAENKVERLTAALTRVSVWMLTFGVPEGWPDEWLTDRSETLAVIDAALSEIRPDGD